MSAAGSAGGSGRSSPDADGEAGEGAPAVRVEGLSRRFGAVTAVDELSFSVGRGELFGLVGPDGAGKTTTLRMLAGVLPPTGGEATVFGVSVLEDPEAVKGDLAYMSQRFGLYADLTVRENLEFYADLYRVPRGDRPARLERLYRFSGLAPFEDRLAGNLSGGMKQKLGLSCALVHEPRLLLLDEPTFGVDPISRRDLWLIIHEMVARGVTVIVSTAYMDEAERFDRLLLVQEGRALAVDSPDALRDSLSGRLLAVRAEPLREARARLRPLPSVRRAAAFGHRLHLVVDAAEAARREVTSALADAGFEGFDVEELEPSMEDVFMDRLTGPREAPLPGTGEDRAAGPGQDRATGPAQDRATGPGQDRAAGPAQDRATGPAQDRDPGSGKGRNARGG